MSEDTLTREMQADILGCPTWCESTSHGEGDELTRLGALIWRGADGGVGAPEGAVVIDHTGMVGRLGDVVVYLGRTDVMADDGRMEGQPVITVMGAYGSADLPLPVVRQVIDGLAGIANALQL